ncbi:MAG: riboflavin synthase [Desulfomonile sp.]|jgi:riboflavin synthase
MFTGIVEGRGQVTRIDTQGGFVRIRFFTDLDLSDVKQGDSIAVDGVCLTATSADTSNREFAADVSPETLRVTTLGELKTGEGVNLEKAMVLGSRIGGHMVSGHVDCVGRIHEKRQSGPGFLIGISVDSGHYLIEKGSVAVDGVSLTVNSVQGNRFWITIIPYTALLTGLTQKKINDRVNVEFDLIGKYIEKFLPARPKDSGIDEKTLEKYGFM